MSIRELILSRLAATVRGIENRESRIKDVLRRLERKSDEELLAWHDRLRDLSHSGSTRRFDARHE